MFFISHVLGRPGYEAKICLWVKYMYIVEVILVPLEKLTLLCPGREDAVIIPVFPYISNRVGHQL